MPCIQKVKYLNVGTKWLSKQGTHTSHLETLTSRKSMWLFLIYSFICSTSPLTSSPLLLRLSSFLATPQISSVQLLSHVWLFVTPWTTKHQASITNSRSPPKPMSIKSVILSNHLILCHPLLLLPSIFPSIRVFSNNSALHIRWPKDWSFSFNISPSNEHPGLISLRVDWLDLLAVQGTLKSLPQHHSSNASVLQCSAFFTVQLSHPYMTTGKTRALTRWTFVGKVMSLLFNMLSMFLLFFYLKKIKF